VNLRTVVAAAAVLVLLLVGFAAYRIAVSSVVQEEPLTTVSTDVSPEAAPAPSTQRQQDVARQLRGNAWEEPENTPLSRARPADDNVEFEQAERIQDSREDSLRQAKRDVNIIIDAVNNNN